MLNAKFRRAVTSEGGRDEHRLSVRGWGLFLTVGRGAKGCVSQLFCLTRVYVIHTLWSSLL